MHADAGQGKCQLLSPQHVNFESSAVATGVPKARNIEKVPWALRQTFELFAGNLPFWQQHRQGV